MPSVQYGNTTIEYNISEKPELKSHYITVEKGRGVTLKGKSVAIETSDKLILKKARWIIDKLELVRSISEEEIVTGARIQYLGRRYYVELLINDKLEKIDLDFTESKFKIHLPSQFNNQEDLNQALETFFRAKATEKITPRIRKWSKTTGLTYHDLKFRKLEKRWGSCTPTNTIIINFDAIKLPFSLIDYLIVHELVHTKIKDHSKAFWAELSKHIPNWKELDYKMFGMKM